MRKNLIILLLLFYASNIYSQPVSLPDSVSSLLKSKHPKTARHESFYISTDVLSLVNSLISNKELVLTFISEICFNHSLGLQLSTSLKSEYNPAYRRSRIVLCPEFRWYYLNENCSAFHFGTFCSFEKANVSVEKNGSPSGEYRELVFITGISGGYKALLNDRWMINPVVYAGLSNKYRSHYLKNESTSYFYRGTDIAIRILLQVGYRF